MGTLDGKVALITGAARGMGASHAKVLAGKGAAVVMLDAPGPVPTAEYAMSTAEALHEHAAAIREAGGQALAIEGDVRSQDDLDGAVAKALSEFGQNAHHQRRPIGTDASLSNFGERLDRP